jgi:hypothetical protein
LHQVIARRRGSRDLNRPQRGRDPPRGCVRPMPSPGGNTTRPDRRPASSSFVLGRRRRPAGIVLGRAGGLRALQLDPGRAGWSRPGPTGRPHHRAARRRQRAHKVPEAHRLIAGERMSGVRARWRRRPGRTRRRDRARAGGLPARRRPQQDACPWTCQRIARASATGPLAPPHSSLCDPAFELWQDAAGWCCARSRELAAPP